MGRRNVSNVPAQALTLMNDPFVVAEARIWAERATAARGEAPQARLASLYETAFGRPPGDQETRTCLAFVEMQKQAHAAAGKQSEETERLAWSDLCHVLVNMKEFIFVN